MYSSLPVVDPLLGKVKEKKEKKLQAPTLLVLVFAGTTFCDFRMELVRTTSLSPVTMELRTRRPFGWQVKNWQMRHAENRKGRLGMKKEGRVSIVSRAGSGFLLFSRLWSLVVFMGVAAIHFKRTTSTPWWWTCILSDCRPTRSFFMWGGGLSAPNRICICQIVIKSGSPKTPERWRSFFTEDGAPMPWKYSVDFEKQKQKQRKSTAESWSPAKHSAEPQSASLSDGCSVRSMSSRSSACSVTGRL